MTDFEHVTEVFQNAMEIPYDNTSRFVFISDCHRGDGSYADDFSKNQNLFFAALKHYYNENYTYIEIGDGDELWKNRKFSDIMNTHSDVFWLLSKFYKEDRLYFIYGNHDLVKENPRFAKENYYKYYDERKKCYVPLFENVVLHEGIVLKHKLTEEKILLIHGHQVDYLNDRLWKLSRFLVRHLWRPLETVGIKDPTSTSLNFKNKDAVEYKLIEWVTKEKHMLIAGHTHRPMFPEVGEPPYFNDGSCVHPRCITAIEISEGTIQLVKWSIKTKKKGTLYIGKDVLAGPRNIHSYYENETSSEEKLFDF